MIGTTHQVSIAPPVNNTSVTFIATSIPIIEIRDMPSAVFKAKLSDICRERITVSSAMEVISPFRIARLMIAQTGQGMPVT